MAGWLAALTKLVSANAFTGTLLLGITAVVLAFRYKRRLEEEEERERNERWRLFHLNRFNHNPEPPRPRADHHFPHHFDDDDDGWQLHPAPFNWPPAAVQQPRPQPVPVQAQRRQQQQQQPQNVNARAGGVGGGAARPARAPRPPREAPEVTRERRRHLAAFQCPFEEEENACRRGPVRGCPFGHQANARAQQNSSELKDLPSYLCTYNLLGICTSPTPEDCINGLHLTAYNELLDLPALKRRNRRQIEQFFGADRDRQCYICQEVVLEKVLSRKQRFAILENCTHAFCADCLKQWAVENYQLNYQLHSPSEVSCPVCRTISRRFIIRRRFTDKPGKKRALFAAAQPVH